MYVLWPNRRLSTMVKGGERQNYKKEDSAVFEKTGFFSAAHTCSIVAKVILNLMIPFSNVCPTSCAGDW